MAREPASIAKPVRIMVRPMGPWVYVAAWGGMGGGCFNGKTSGSLGPLPGSGANGEGKHECGGEREENGEAADHGMPSGFGLHGYV